MFEHARARRRFSITVVLLAVLAASCGKSATNPTPMLSTETLTGTLGVLGSDFKTFRVNYVQLVTDASVTVTSLTTTAGGTPLTVTIGVGFGSIAFDGTCTRSPAYSTPTAALNKELIAAGVFQAGEYCVQIYDSGTLTEPTNYTLVVKHY